MANKTWISVDDRLPEDGQHVLVWNDRFNVKVGNGDDDHGCVRMGDAFFRSGQARWDSMRDGIAWGDDPEKFKEDNGWHRWIGQGPCSFGSVRFWMPMPESPTSQDKESEEGRCTAFPQKKKSLLEFIKTLD